MAIGIICVTIILVALLFFSSWIEHRVSGNENRLGEIEKFMQIVAKTILELEEGEENAT